MTWWEWVGGGLVLTGAIEFVLFRFVLAGRADIARRQRLLMMNAAFNVVVGIALVATGILT